MTDPLARRPILTLKRPVTVVLPPELRPKPPPVEKAQWPRGMAPAGAHQPGRIQMLTARALKVTMVLNADEVAALKVKDGVPRVELRIAAPGRVVTVDLAAKSIRKAVAVLAEVGVERGVAILQGKLGAGDRLEEAGLAVQVKAVEAAP
jgi:hypothetical protein